MYRIKHPIDMAMNPEILDEAWRKLRRKHTPWSETVSRDSLEQHLLLHIITCKDDVLAGRYKPQSIRQFSMEKPTGGRRVLSAQYLRDKLVQRALLIVFEPIAERIFHSDSYAYRPGRNVGMALDKVRERVRIGQCWLVDADIRSFFDSIPHKQLIELLKKFVRDNKTMRIIEQWLAVGAHHTSLLRKRRGISQGAILSPLFCNLYLHQFDTALARENIPFVRFADDFLLFADTYKNAEKAMAFAANELQQLGLNLHPEKTRIIKSNPGVRFLGVNLPKAPNTDK